VVADVTRPISRATGECCAPIDQEEFRDTGSKSRANYARLLPVADVGVTTARSTGRGESRRATETPLLSQHPCPACPPACPRGTFAPLCRPPTGETLFQPLPIFASSGFFSSLSSPLLPHSRFPPRASASVPLPSSLRAPCPAILVDCLFAVGDFQIFYQSEFLIFVLFISAISTLTMIVIDVDTAYPRSYMAIDIWKRYWG